MTVTHIYKISDVVDITKVLLLEAKDGSMVRLTASFEYRLPHKRFEVRSDILIRDLWKSLFLKNQKVLDFDNKYLDAIQKINRSEPWRSIPSEILFCFDTGTFRDYIAVKTNDLKTVLLAINQKSKEV